MELKDEEDICVCRADKKSVNWENYEARKQVFCDLSCQFMFSTIQGDRRHSAPHAFSDISSFKVKNGNMKEIRLLGENN